MNGHYISKVKRLGFDILKISCAAFMKKYTSESAMLNLRKCAEDCEVTLGMEVLNRFEGYMINTCEECKKYMIGLHSVRLSGTYHEAILTKQSRFTMMCYNH